MKTLTLSCPLSVKVTRDLVSMFTVQEQNQNFSRELDKPSLQQ